MVADGCDGEAFLDRHAAVGLLHTGEHRVVVDRAQGTQVDHLGLDAVLGQTIRRLQRVGHADTPADDGDVATLAPDLRLAEGHGEILQNGHVK